MGALAGVAKLVAASAAGYVITRAGFVFFDWSVAVVWVVLLVLVPAVYAARHRAWAVAVGLPVGAAISGVALTL